MGHQSSEGDLPLQWHQDHRTWGQCQSSYPPGQCSFISKLIYILFIHLKNGSNWSGWIMMMSLGRRPMKELRLWTAVKSWQPVGNSEKALGAASPEVNGDGEWTQKTCWDSATFPWWSSSTDCTMLFLSEPNVSATSQTKPVSHFLPPCLSHQPSWPYLTYSFLPAVSQAPEHPVSWMLKAWSHVPPGHPWGEIPHSWGGEGSVHRALVFPFFTLKSSWLLTTN